MTDKVWKQTERKIASMLGGERVPVTGRQRGSAPDIEHDWLSLEVKHKKSLPKWLHDAMDQAEKSVVNIRQLPMVVLHESRQPHVNDYCIVKLGDFVDWFEPELNQKIGELS